jgi:hypothetical protein
MKIKSLALSAAAAVIIPVAGLSGSAAADSPGQIGGGDIYRVKNITKNTDFADLTTANACDELQYKIRLHNSRFGEVTNIVANATLPAGPNSVSKMTVNYTSEGPETSVSDTATVNLSTAQNINYVNGSTQLLDGNNNVIKALSDGVTAGGVNVGDLKGSTTEFVQFKAKVNCPTPPQTPPTTPATPAAPGAPTTLVNTGAGSVAAIFAAATVAGVAAYRFVLGRRLSRQ